MPNLDQKNDRLCIIAESDPFMARLLQRFAEKSGLRTQFARTGDDVLELAIRRPALIVLDPELPGKVRGWEIAQSLRSDSQPIPVIICSWFNKTDVLMLVGQISAYMQKPDLSYEDFADALKVAGVKNFDQSDIN